MALDGSVARSGLEVYLEEIRNDGVLPAGYRLEKALRLDLVEDAFRELSVRPDMAEQLGRAKERARRYGI